MKIEKHKKFLNETKASISIFNSQKEELVKSLEDFELDVKALKEAKEIINATGILAQEEVQQVIEQLVTECLQYIFGESFSFKMENRIVRNQPETYLYVLENGNLFSLKEDEAGGVLDIVSLALRIAVWAIQVNKTQNIMIFDEPAKNLSKDNLDSFGKMLKSLVSNLMLQIIMVSHEKDLINLADKSFVIKRENSISKVEVLS